MSNDTIDQHKNKQKVIPTPILDYDLYRADLTDLELTAEQENELLAILWDIMRMMCDLNLDMDAVQMIIPPSLYSTFNDKTDDESDAAEKKINSSADTENDKR